MNKHSSFLVGLLLALTFSCMPWVLKDCNEPQQERRDSRPTCSLASNYEFAFDSTQCTLKIRNTSQECNLEYSLDQVRWDKVVDGVIPLSNTITMTGPCPIVLKDLSSGAPRFMPYKGTSTCNCKPPFDAQDIYDVVANPISKSLVAASCRCSDFVFVFPNGDKLSAAQVSLKLHLDRLNDIQYSVDSIDENDQKVYLK